MPYSWTSGTANASGSSSTPLRRTDPTPSLGTTSGGVTGVNGFTPVGAKPITGAVGSYSPTTPVTGNVHIGADTSQYSSPDFGLIGQYARMSPEETAQLGQVTDLARLLQGEGQGLYNVAMPAYAQALSYMQAILGGDKAAAARAVGPTAGAIGDVYAGQRKAIEASGLRGGARDTALAAAMQGQTRDIGNLLPNMQQGVINTAAQMGLAGAQAGGQFQQTAAGLHAQVAQLYQQQGQFAVEAEMQNRFGVGQLNVANRGLDIQQALGNKAIDLQQEGLTQQNNQFQQSFGLQTQQFDWLKQYQQQQLALQQQQIAAQQKQQQGSKWGSLLGAGLGLVGNAIAPGIGGALGGGLGSIIGSGVSYSPTNGGAYTINNPVGTPP